MHVDIHMRIRIHIRIQIHMHIQIHIHMPMHIHMPSVKESVDFTGFKKALVHLGIQIGEKDARTVFDYVSERMKLLRRGGE